MLEIQERDKKLLMYMAKYGIVNREKINQIYNFKKDGYSSYITKRKKRLSDEGYIVKNNKYAYLGAKGKRYLESLGVVEFRIVSTNKFSRDNLAKISSLLIELEDIYEIEQSPKVKERLIELLREEIKKDDKEREKKLSEMISDVRKYKVKAKLINKVTGKDYYLYNIGKIDKPSSKMILLKEYYIRDIKKEIRKLRQKLDIKNVIIMAEDKMTMDIYKENVETLLEGEQLLLPYTEGGIYLLKELGKRNVKKEVMRSLYGTNYTLSDWRTGDYRVGDTHIIILINNDVSKIRSINDYFSSGVFDYTRKTKVEVICLEDQEESIRKQLPAEVLIKTINFNF